MRKPVAKPTTARKVMSVKVPAGSTSAAPASSGLSRRPASKPAAKTAVSGARPATAAVPGGRRTLGALHVTARPNSASAAEAAEAGKSALEALAENYDSRQPSARRDGDNNDDDNDDDVNSIGRHADLDNMSPESASFRELVAIRERQHVKMRDVLLRYNHELQGKVDTLSTLGSQPRPGSMTPRGTHLDGEHGSPSTGEGGDVRRGRAQSLLVADEAAIIEELLREETAAGSKRTTSAVDGESGEAATTATSGGEEGAADATKTTTATTGEGGLSSPDAANSDGKKRGDRAASSSSALSVSRTALRAIIKHTQDTVSNAIDDERHRQSEFEAAVLARMQAMEQQMHNMSRHQREKSQETRDAEQADHAVRSSEVQPMQRQLAELKTWVVQKQRADAEHSERLAEQVKELYDRIGGLVQQISEHQADVDKRTADSASALTSKAIDDAATRVRELCEQVQQGLLAVEKCRDDVPQAVAAAAETIEASLSRAMHSEFESQNVRIKIAEEHQSAVNTANREAMTQELQRMQTAVDGSLGEMRAKYDGQVSEHVRAVRVEAEKYEEARRAALPIPDGERVNLMKEELENALQMLRFLTEASSTAMTSTIPPRLERSEQKIAMFEAAMESQQQELDRLRCSNLRFDVAVGPDNLKDAWLGVSTYRAPPPIDEDEDEDDEASDDDVEENKRHLHDAGDDEDGAPPPPPGGDDDIDADNENKAHGGGGGSKRRKHRGGNESMAKVQRQIDDALRLIARRATGSLSPLRGHYFDGTPRSGGRRGAAAAAAGEHFSGNASGSSSGGAPLSSSSRRAAGLDATAATASSDLPANFASLPPRDKLYALTSSIGARRSQLLAVQKVLTNIQHAFHDLTSQEAEVISSITPSNNSTGSAGNHNNNAPVTPRTISEHQAYRKICDEIATRKQRMYEKERSVLEKRNKISRELEMLQNQEAEVFREMQQQQKDSGTNNNASTKVRSAESVGRYDEY